ncbi:elongation factor GreAB [Mangrovimonas yunxiaonensis]|uniref:Elongation factor GreAB n=1 Tax=Mangrovimonas yunxiaonensis TaxID=1197477 RepID=A0A084TJR5_9FLAO|nr:GreA/GreB family elongation factor [Mangrovimonas yunxiaonensis]KFB00951.1 elongation factor GreAB [Mangrovimonas yunxiaonensis]
MEKNIIVTTGIYDVIKDHVRRKKVTKAEEDRLLAELKNAKQVRRRELPDTAVTVNRRVTILDHSNQEKKEYIFVPTTRVKLKKNKHSILSDMALATVGYCVGDTIEWPFRTGKKKIEIVKVEPFEQL